jgi:hypothetical protein
MGFTVYDFDQSLDRVSMNPETISAVLAAWGENGWSSDWEGGFLMLLKDGRFAYLSGWCDETGWGCQDGATVDYFTEWPDLQKLHEGPWDEHPTDLNRFLRGEISRLD